MTVFKRMATEGYGELHLRRDPDTGLQAIVAIHDTRLGPALGGTRMLPYPSEEEAIADVLQLARAMTYKAALAGLAHGGGKAVILRPREEFDREAWLMAHGRFVDSLGGRYICAADSGTGALDMAVIRRVTPYVTGVAEESGGAGDSSPLTALGVRRGIEACAKAALGRDDLQGLHVAVQGVGHVGAHLCRELSALGATLTVADMDATRCAEMRERYCAAVVAPETIHATACDVFAPCALGGILKPASIAELTCRVVAGGANNQLQNPQRDGQLLAERGVLYAPDYAINSGGLIHVAQEYAGYDGELARARTMGIYDTVLEIAEQALEAGRLPAEVADAMVEARLAG